MTIVDCPTNWPSGITKILLILYILYIFCMLSLTMHQVHWSVSTTHQDQTYYWAFSPRHLWAEWEKWGTRRGANLTSRSCDSDSKHAASRSDRKHTEHAKTHTNCRLNFGHVALLLSVLLLYNPYSTSLKLASRKTHKVPFSLCFEKSKLFFLNKSI